MFILSKVSEKSLLKIIIFCFFREMLQLVWKKITKNNYVCFFQKKSCNLYKKIYY